jgi:hypothetical protein
VRGAGLHASFLSRRIAFISEALGEPHSGTEEKPRPVNRGFISQRVPLGHGGLGVAPRLRYTNPTHAPAEPCHRSLHPDRVFSKTFPVKKIGFATSRPAPAGRGSSFLAWRRCQAYSSQAIA